MYLFNKQVKMGGVRAGVSFGHDAALTPSAPQIVEMMPKNLVTRRKPMSKKLLTLLSITAVLATVLTACGGAKGGIPENAALKITGNVENEVGWTEDEVRAMDTIEAESTNKSGETKSYTGVSIGGLLDEASVKADATTVVFVGEDDYTAEVALAEVQGCGDCIVSFRNNGGFSIVMPGFPGNVQVKGVVEIQVK
jgi:hypothetical protein